MPHRRLSVDTRSHEIEPDCGFTSSSGLVLGTSRRCDVAQNLKGWLHSTITVNAHMQRQRPLWRSVCRLRLKGLVYPSGPHILIRAFGLALCKVQLTFETIMQCCSPAV